MTSALMSGAPRFVIFATASLVMVSGCSCVQGAENGLALTPPLGWSSWSALLTNVDEASVKAIAAKQASTLKSAGYVYVNVDGGWYLNPNIGVDSNGRWLAHPVKFPNGMRSLGDYIHGLGLKFGIYVTPGIPKLAVDLNTPVEGTTYRASEIADRMRTETTYLGGTMYGLDYTRPGSQQFVNSWARLFASWGVDYLKLDGIRKENVPDVIAWSRALLQTGRPIHLELANNLDPSHAETWRRYSNGWRISTDIESYNGKTLTTWEHVALRFALAPKWLGAAQRGGWNDLDSLLVGGDRTGLTPDERQTMMTFWALSSSPLIVGDDLRNLDELAVRLLTNPEVIRINQNGIVAAPLNSSRPQQVWVSLQPDGSFALGLFNLGAAPAFIEVPWSSLGFVGSARVWDVWAALDLGSFPQSFGVQVDPHASRLLRIVPRAPIVRRLAITGEPRGGAVVRASTVGARGQRAESIGLGGTLTFANVDLTCGGVYELTISYVNGDETPRSAMLRVNGTDYPPLTFPGAGDWAANVTEQGITTSVMMTGEGDTIVLRNPAGPAPDVIGISLQLRRSSMKRTDRSICSWDLEMRDQLFGGG